MKKITFLAIALFAIANLWATNLAQWTFDKAYDVNEETHVYTPNAEASVDVTGWFNSIVPHILPNTFAGTQTDYELSAMSTGRYWQLCTGHDNRVLRIENVNANAITNFTDPAQHNVYYEVSFPTLSYQNIAVTYHLAYGGNAEAPIHMVYSTNNGTTWTEAGTNNTSNCWWIYNESTQSLNATHKANVIVRLIADNGFASNWNLLDVTVTGEAYEAPEEGQPVTFGVGRTIETAATATTPNILAAGQEVVKGTIPTDFVVTNTTTCDYTNNNATLYRGATDQDNTFTAPKAWRNMIKDVAVNNAFDDTFYCGFSVVVPTGKVLNVSQIFGDLIAQKNNTNFKFQVYKGGVKVYESADRGNKNAQSGGAAGYPMTVNTSEVAALQNMGGTIEFRMPWYIASTAASGAVLDFNITATVAEKSLDTYNVVYSLGETPVTAGTAPQTETVTEGNSIAIPVNTFLYKEGYTLTGWTDGENTYAAGDLFTPTADATLTAVFVANTKSVATTEKALTLRWPFAQKDGCQEIAIEGAGKVAYIIRQAKVDGEMQDLALKIDASAGKFNNAGREDEWAQVNGGTVFSFPSSARATITSKVYADPTAETTLDGAAYTDYTGGVATWAAAPTDGISTLTVAGGGYYSYIEVNIPKAGNPWDNYADIAVDLTNGAYIHSDETSVITIGIKKDGENVVRTETDDADVIATIAGKFHSNEHGLQNFSMTIGVPGPVKITAGTCAWGGNLTIRNAEGTFNETINTNTGACFHQNKTNNVVYTYYTGAATTLTISGGNYMPYIAVEEAVAPTQHTVTFKNGETTVSTIQVYDGTGIGTLPAAPAVAEGMRFRGWYTATDGTGTKVFNTTVVEEDMTLYAFIMAIPAMEDGCYVVSAEGDIRMNGETLLNALEYCATQDLTAIQKIRIANGTYDLGTACRTELKNNFVLLGESRDGVLIVNHPTAPGIQATSTLRITGNNVYLQHLTLRCDVSYSTSSTHGVGVALEINGNQSICYDVDLQCNQDTYYSNVNDAYVGYFRDGRIEGTVDFICGGGNMWFENTTLYCNQRYDGNAGQFTNAADVIGAPATGVASQYGYVLNNCTIDGANCQNNNYNLARGWQNSPAMTWLNTTCIMTPSAQGYTNMSAGLVCRFHEFNTKDAAATELAHTHSLTNPRDLGYSAQSEAIYLTADQAATYTKANVFGAWDPDAIILSYNPIIPTAVDNANVNANVNKILRDGHIVIIRDGRMYDVLGR